MQNAHGIIFANRCLSQNAHAMHFKSLVHLLDHFKDEQTCIKYYEKTRWNGNPVCPHCGTEKPYITNPGYKCRDKNCRKKFNVKTGTIFENTKLSMRIWFAAIYLFTTSKKGVSSLQLSRQLNISQKSAWFLLHRVREMLKEKAPQMIRSGEPIEIDEAYVGGKERNKHYNKKRSRKNPDMTNEGRVYKPKKTILGIIQRGGAVVLKYIPNTNQDSVINIIRKNIQPGATIYTDEHNYYRPLSQWYSHQTINHSEKEYVSGDIYTNTIENFWAILKRGIIGIYHSISEKHIDRYLAEFATRYNTQKMNHHLKFEKLLAQSNVRLPYKNLISNAA